MPAARASAAPDRPGRGRRRRRPWRSPVTALLLGGTAIGLGAAGFGVVTEQPQHAIEFVVEEGLPHGIDQASVEAAAEDVALSRTPFTIRVVERELEWEETYRGEIGDADMLLSIGQDPDDPDLVLEDAGRVAFSGEDSGGENYSAATEIRATFNNNLTLGHGPSAVVGAALTAADLRFDDGMRSPAVWASLAALPMFAAVVVAHLWLRDRSRERNLTRRLSRAKLRLARVVLELDALQIRFVAAEAALTASSAADADSALAPLRADWEAIRRESLQLAREEQTLTGIFADRAWPHDGETLDGAIEDLLAFDRRTTGLQQRADALADASELRAGHAGSESALARLALPLLQSIAEVLDHRRRFAAEADDLRLLRDRLLVLTREAGEGSASAGASDRDRPVTDHTDLLARWADAERAILEVTARMVRRLRGESGGARSTKRARASATSDERALQHIVDERVEARVLTMTAGASPTIDPLRASLGLAEEGRDGPLHATERVLALLARMSAATSTDPPADRPAARWELAGLLAPIAIGLLAGWIAVADADVNTAYGRTLTGDEPLAGLTVYGDPGLLPEAAESAASRALGEATTHAESLQLPFVRERMARVTENSDDRALLPDELDLVVAIVPIGDYLDYREHPEFDGRLELEYADLLDAQRQLVDDVAATHPDVLDPATGEVRLGHGILPVWVLPDETYAPGATLTGEISSGPDSRLGAYYFTATEPRVLPDADYQPTIGETVAYDLTSLALAMEYNHQESATVAPSAVFWTVGVTGWAGSQTALLLGVAAAARRRRRAGTRAARAALRDLQRTLDRLALGLDTSRLDVVAVLGSGSPTDGRAEEADQRLYEATLVTAFRELRDLASHSRSEQRGDEWAQRVDRVRQLIETLSARELDVAARADSILRLQRRAG